MEFRPIHFPSSATGDINVLTQCMTDEKTAFFKVKFQSTIDGSSSSGNSGGDQERVINIVAQDTPQGFYKSLQKVKPNESLQIRL